MGKGRGFGKTILIGDQFVPDGVPAIVSSISFQTEAVVERTGKKGWVLEDNRIEVPGYKASKADHTNESISRILEVMKIDSEKNPLKITFGGDLLAGSGVGASAASCVSLARALDEEFNLNLSIEEINQIAWEGEFAYHGIPSGVDNTASCYGGLLLYQLTGSSKRIEQIKIKEPVRVVLGNTGVSANTRDLVALGEKLHSNDPEGHRRRLNVITEQAENIKNGLENFRLEDVGRIMTENHAMLIDMGLSHEKLVYLCNLAIKKGALGAKLTGGGMGGFMIALTPEADLQEKVAASMEAEGFFVIRTAIGGNTF